MEHVDHYRALRDLMGLLALPGLWAGRDGRAIVEIMTEAAERIVPFTISYVEVEILPGELLCVLRVAGREIPADSQAAWQPFIRACQACSVDHCAIDDTPRGRVQLSRFPLTSGTNSGNVWLACERADFPTFEERSFLRACVSLAANGLNTARIAHKAEMASRAKDEFLAMLGHELRNPLAPIVTALHLMRMRSDRAPMREQEIIERQVGHLSRLVDDLLDVTRITRGKVELALERVDVVAALTQALESVSPLIEERRHVVTVDTEKGHGTVLADPTRLQQVFSNLIANAAKYTNPGGRIAIVARILGTTVEVQVRDDGSGIGEALLPRVFDLFEQGAVSLARSAGGLGIGLAVVKRLVELHDGTVTAQSAGPGKGSCFTVTLPLIAPAALAARVDLLELPSMSPPLAATRILIVDDNQDALETLQALLRLRGYHVASASDPFEALDVAVSFWPDISILDIGLPVLSGYELAAELRNRMGHKAGKFVALTGYSQAGDRDRSRDAGFVSHLAKPVDAQSLFAILEEISPKGGAPAPEAAVHRAG